MTDMNCLLKTIGLKTECEEIAMDGSTDVSQVRYWLNDAPGVSVKFGNDVSSDDYVDGRDFMISAAKHASTILVDEAMGTFGGDYRYNAVKDNKCFGMMTGSYEPLGTGARGVRITKSRASTLRLKIVKIDIMSNTADEAYTLTLKDGGLTKYFDVKLTPHVKATVYLNYKAETDTVTITGDQSVIQLWGTTMVQGGGCCGSNRTSYYNATPDLVVMGINEADIEHANKVFGIMPCVMLECDDSYAFCSVADKLAAGLFYKTCGLLFRNAANSKQINKFTWYGKEKAMEESTHYDNASNNADKQGLYQKQMAITKKNLYRHFLNTGDDCFACEQPGYGYVSM